MTTHETMENYSNPTQERFDSETDALAIAGELTRFEHDVLVVLAAETRIGMRIKEALESTPRYDVVHHGRLYPVLDDLADRGLIEKTAVDCRANECALTDRGIDVLLANRDWMNGYLPGGEA